MSRMKKYSLIGVAVFLCISLVVLGGLINTTRANLVRGNGSEVEMDLTSMDVKILENGQQVTDENGEGVLLASLKNTIIDPGYTYDEEVAVKNTGSTPEFVRVIVTKYWTKNDVKDTSVEPGMIQLLQENEDWFINESESTPEKTVYYYRNVLEEGETTPLLFNAMKLDSGIAKDFTVEPDPANAKVLKANFAYSGSVFHIDVEAQSVQSEHAEDAIPSAWGVNNLAVKDSVISLAQ